jgi:hypothetical protein
LARNLNALPQPVGVYANWLLNAEGYVSQGGGVAEVVVIDIGINTFDLYVIQATENVNSFFFV